MCLKLLSISNLVCLLQQNLIFVRILLSYISFDVLIGWGGLDSLLLEIGPLNDFMAKTVIYV